MACILQNAKHPSSSFPEKLDKSLGRGIVDFLGFPKNEQRFISLYLSKKNLCFPILWEKALLHHNHKKSRFVANGKGGYKTVMYGSVCDGA